ncbi:MAG TPA: hypothetical protein PLW14_00370 [Chlorobiota bacterium]|nr:hypothetical protein [Chlorobiota bacterium]
MFTVGYGAKTSEFCRSALFAVLVFATTNIAGAQENLSTTVYSVPSYVTSEARPTRYVRTDDGSVIRASCFDVFYDVSGTSNLLCVESAISLDSGKTWLHETANEDPDTSVVLDEAGEMQIRASVSRTEKAKTEVVTPTGNVFHERIAVFPHQRFYDGDMVWYPLTQSKDSSQFFGVSPTISRRQTFPGYVSTVRSGRIVTAHIVELDDLGTPGIVIRWRYAGDTRFDSIVVEALGAVSILDVTATYYGINIVRVRNRDDSFGVYIQEPGMQPEEIVKFSDRSTQWFSSLRGYLFGKTNDNRYVSRHLQSGVVTDLGRGHGSSSPLPFELWSNGENSLWSDGVQLIRVSTGIVSAVTDESNSKENLRVVGDHIVMPSDVSGRLMITDAIGRSNTEISAKAGENVEIPNGIIGHIFISLLCPDGSVRRASAFVR